MPIKAEIVRNRLQDLIAQSIQGSIEPANLRLELRNLGRPNIGWHDPGIGMTLRQVAAHMPEFLQIVVFMILGGFDPEGGIAPLPAGPGDVFRFCGFRQGKEGLGIGDRRAQSSFIQAMIRDHRKAVPLKALAELGCKAVEVGLEGREGDRRECVGGGLGHDLHLYPDPGYRQTLGGILHRNFARPIPKCCSAA